MQHSVWQKSIYLWKPHSTQSLKYITYINVETNTNSTRIQRSTHQICALCILEQQKGYGWYGSLLQCTEHYWAWGFVGRLCKLREIQIYWEDSLPLLHPPSLSLTLSFPLCSLWVCHKAQPCATNTTCQIIAPHMWSPPAPSPSPSPWSHPNTPTHTPCIRNLPTSFCF